MYLFGFVMIFSSSDIVDTQDILTLEGVHILLQGVLHTTHPSHQSPLSVSYGVLWDLGICGALNTVNNDF